MSSAQCVLSLRSMLLISTIQFRFGLCVVFLFVCHIRQLSEPLQLCCNTWILLGADWHHVLGFRVWQSHPAANPVTATLFKSAMLFKTCSSICSNTREALAWIKTRKYDKSKSIKSDWLLIFIKISTLESTTGAGHDHCPCVSSCRSWSVYSLDHDAPVNN